MQGFEHRLHVVGREVGIEHLDRLADDLLARAPVGAFPGAVEVEHDAALVEDADRVGHRVEQRGVAQACALGIDAAVAQGVRRACQQAAGAVGKGAVAGGGVERCGDPLRVVPGGVVVGIRSTRGIHDTAGSAAACAVARPTRLPVSRPRQPASQRPVSASASRSMPVCMPMPCSIYTTSSLATLPLAPCA